MAEMFDDVSGRYDLLNRVMTLGRDRTWREAMWRGVPETAGAVLDLCTGSGVSLDGLRRPGRLVVGVDVSLDMLSLAASRQRRSGWAPRLVCADAFALPFRDGALDAVTIAFGVRNLRPRREALGEIARVLGPGGALSVLEAAAPAPGPLAPLHRLYLARLVPLAGRLSSEPSAYRYLAQSVLEFGAGPDFEIDMRQAGFRIETRRRFMLGAARLWVARRSGPDGQIAPISPAPLQDATAVRTAAGGRATIEAERTTWSAAQALVSLALALALAYGAWAFARWNAALPLRAWQRQLAWALILAGTIVFGLRATALAGRWFANRRGR
jgi:demethylmenaquinone methyltransferase/2-methoxy-6-polyprenyl-1,4-benzoquinol methylase